MTEIYRRPVPGNRFNRELMLRKLDRRRFLLGSAALAGSAVALAACSPRDRQSTATPTLAPTATAGMPTATGSSGLQGALQDLANRLTGTLLLPGEPNYDTASAATNGRYLDIRPMAVAQVADEADVVTCVQWCNENGVQPVPRAGGHSYAGFSSTSGLLVDISRLNSIEFDQSTGLMTVGGATSNRGMLDATINGPFFMPGGTCLPVCYGGLALGGGIGYNAHWAGIASDLMTASRIVTASGDVLDIDESTNSDLFWACRGGAGGNFGINTSFTFQLVESPTFNVTYYRYDWTGAEAAGLVLDAFNNLIATAPNELNAVAMAQATEIGNGSAEEAIAVMSRGQFIGPIDDLRDLIAPLLEIGSPDSEVLEEMTFWDAQMIWPTEEAPPHSWGDISRYAADPIPQSAVEDIVELLVSCPSRSEDANGSFWSLGWVGGVNNDYGRTDTAYVHRGVSTLLRPTTVWPNDAPPSVGDGLNAWSAQIIDTIAPFTPDESYQNFPNRSLENWAQLYYAENYERLVDIKTQFDPTNLFQNEQSIPPRG